MKTFQVEYNEKTGYYKETEITKENEVSVYGNKNEIFKSINEHQLHLFYDLMYYGFPFEPKKVKFKHVMYQSQVFKKAINNEIYHITIK